MTIEQAIQAIRASRAVGVLATRAQVSSPHARSWTLGRRVSNQARETLEQAALSLAQEIIAGTYVKSARKIRKDVGVRREYFAGRSLTEREAKIARMRELRDAGHTLKAIGDAQDPPITRERVRQLLKNVLPAPTPYKGSDRFVLILRDAIQTLRAERDSIVGFMQVLERIARDR